MDPLTAISLAGNILTFIDISYNVISGVNKVLSTANGMTPENERLSVLVEDLHAVTQVLVTDIPAQSENEKQLCALAANCHSLSEELYQTLRRLKVGDKKSKWEGLVVKWHSMRKEKEIDSIERRLHGYQSQILIRLQVMFRYVC
jgi:capsule polysaccharide export protein KpsE/RkpR